MDIVAPIASGHELLCPASGETQTAAHAQKHFADAVALNPQPEAMVCFRQRGV